MSKNAIIAWAIFYVIFFAPLFAFLWFGINRFTYKPKPPVKGCCPHCGSKLEATEHKGLFSERLCVCRSCSYDYEWWLKKSEREKYLIYNPITEEEDF